MGLDNGILFRLNGIKNREVEKDLEIHGFDTSDYNESGELELFYWRKCWGVRDSILDILGGYKCGEFEYKITKDQFIMIFKDYHKWLNKEKWDNDGRSVWTYYDIVKHIANDLYRMNYIIENWDKLEIEDINFYDSF